VGKISQWVNHISSIEWTLFTESRKIVYEIYLLIDKVLVNFWMQLYKNSSMKNDFWQFFLHLLVKLLLIITNNYLSFNFSLNVNKYFN
jgi:hypothetical protein